MTRPDHLIVLLGGEQAGTLVPSVSEERIDFTYDDQWRAAPNAYALSLSLPLAGRRFAGKSVAYYLKGLLSDDPSRLRRIAAQFGVAPTDSFGLLAHIGEDCPGAVQFARPERLEALRGGARPNIVIAKIIFFIFLPFYSILYQYGNIADILQTAFAWVIY